jgi:hypothetical protein
MADENLRGDRRDRSPTEVMIHVDAGSLEGEVAGTTADGELLSAETCRRLLCDAGVVPVLEVDGVVLDVGRKTRTVPAAIRRAVALRDGGCQFPGCDNQIVDAHHVVHWADGGETCRDNLVSLCRGHHTFVHEGGASVRFVDGDLVFCDLRGDRIEAVPPRPPAKPLAVDHIDPWLGCATNADPGLAGLALHLRCRVLEPGLGGWLSRAGGRRAKRPRAAGLVPHIRARRCDQS